MVWIKTIAAAVAALSVAACQGPMDIPQVATLSPLEIPTGTETASIAFAGGSSKIPRGTKIAAFPTYGGPSSFSCRGGHMESLEWGGRIKADWSGELGEAFFDTMEGAGYSVVGDPRRIFERGKDISRAQYRLGARLLDVRGNLCNEYDFWTGRLTGRDMGEMYVKVEWEVYSTTENRIVAKLNSEGRGHEDTPSGSGVSQAFLGAFSAATANLAADPAFHDLIVGKKEATAETGTLSKPQTNVLHMRGARVSTRAMKGYISDVLDAVVTIRLSGGHGSGFFIGYDGYGLTNAHVVGQSKTVVIRLRSGIEVEAEVLRVDKIRDVALFKAPIQMLHPLPVEVRDSLTQLDDIYAVGTPHNLGLQSTITKGVVSAFRNERRGGRVISYIQSDVAISGGNSGGPLLNSRGNVVGISVAGWEIGGSQVGLNLFIPIREALDLLKVEIDSAPRP
ncbi:MAG: trypsin-like peptidase domain-containing protein [Rhodospirillaceae bacterium]|nr:trypsin-like peptidase domain-containing protein [Rhodospirillaceae bacterium]